MAYEKIVCLDIDGTLSQQNSWERLNVALGMKPEQDYALFQAYVDGELAYDAWMEQLVMSYTRGEESHQEIVTRLSADTHLVAGAREIVDAVKAAGYGVLLLSGTFDSFVDRVAEELGVADYQACTRIVFDAQGYIQQFDHSGDEHQAKLRLLTEYLAERGLQLDQCICVGDGPNDLDMFQATGKGITFSDSKIVAQAWKVIDTLSDLPKVL
tara:strand:+ start:500 stop:1135 length:636 start_codon:yes stop_codon:yes gene_type:complete